MRRSLQSVLMRDGPIGGGRLSELSYAVRLFVSLLIENWTPIQEENVTNMLSEIR